MKNILNRTVPAWTLMLATVIALASLAFVFSLSAENTYLKNAIRSQEAQIPGFLSEISILSDKALCHKNVFISLRDRLVGSDSCESRF